jgi:hypothetical protein
MAPENANSYKVFTRDLILASNTEYDYQRQKRHFVYFIGFGG